MEETDTGRRRRRRLDWQEVSASKATRRHNREGDAAAAARWNMQGHVGNRAVITVMTLQESVAKGLIKSEIARRIDPLRYQNNTARFL